jgi:predicted nuclease of restriction endonuclease-like (RecB) superfamily
MPPPRKKPATRAPRPARATSSPTPPVAADYAAWLRTLKTRVRSAQTRHAWGEEIVDQVAADLQREFPGITRFSRANVYRMRAFFLSHEKPAPIVAQPARQFRAKKLSQPVTVSAPRLPASPRSGPPEPFASLPWGHNLLLLHRLESAAERAWYARAAVEHGWSRSVLTEQIHQRAHARAGRAATNFAATLPPLQSDLAQQTLKAPYLFDFLALGAGFAFVGRQVCLEVCGEDYFLDLLFYHLRLRCYVVIDLKMEAFRPEFAGKMNFYLSAVDAQLRHAEDRPSIGLLLCQERNRHTVEYALRDLKKPIGVSEWRTRLVESLPKELRGSLPSVEELEAELGARRPAKKRKK